MHALLWDGQSYPHGLRWVEIARPVPTEDWVLIENRATGICGSDLHYLSGEMVHQLPVDNLPAVLGHENAGEIVAVGPGVSNWAVGDRVVAEPLHPCRTFGPNLCSTCMSGQYHRCSSLSFVGIPTNRPLSGGYGEYSPYHISCLFPLPDHVSYEEGAILDVLTCGVHAANVGRPTLRDTVAVLGCGPIGLCTLQVLGSLGIRNTVAVAKHPFQAELAQRFGAGVTVCLADSPDAVSEVRRLVGAADQVYECVGGTSDTVQQGIELCRPGGKIIIVGFFVGVRPVNLERVFLAELSILSACAYSIFEEKREFDMALGLVADGLVDLKPLITHRFPREDWRLALDTAFHKAEHQAVKIVFAG